MLNIKLQGRDQLINKLFERVCAFEVKIRLWVRPLKQCKYANFPTLSASQPNEATFVTFVGQLREQIKTRLTDMRVSNQDFALFATPFPVTVDSVTVHLQMEMIDLQCNTDLKTKFTEVAIVKFYNNLFHPTSSPV